MTLNVEVNQVTQRFDDLTALEGLSLTLNGEKIYGLLGRNGSGKSTLLSIMSAYRKPTEGSVTINGEPVFENPDLMPRVTLIREGADTIDDGKSAHDALCFAASMRPHWDMAFAERLVKRFNLPTKQKISKLSRGQSSMLGIVLGLASRAPVTIVDESYLGLDAPSRYIFYEELLADYMRHPRMIIISTHLIEEVSTLFEEVVIIDRGKLLIQAEKEELLGRGASITGSATIIDQFTAGQTVLSQKQLGPTKSVTLFGSLTDHDRQRATAAGLDVGPIALQDLFVHLTTREGAQD